MNRNQTENRGAAGTNLAIALNKLFSTLSVYPKGHTRCTEAVEAIRAEIQAIASSAPSLFIDFGKNRLLVQSNEVDLECHEAERIHSLFSALGISRIEVDKSVSVDALHAFISEINRCRQRTQGSKGFQQIEFRDLPETVRVFQREFGKRIGTGADPVLQREMIAAALHDTLEYLEEQTSDPEMRRAGMSLIESVFTKVAERFEMSSQAPMMNGGSFGKSLDEALNLGVYAIQHAITKMFSNRSAQGNIKDLFGLAEKAVALSEDRKSVELMIDILRQCEKENKDQDQSRLISKKDEDEFKLSLPELRQRIESCADAAAPLTHLDMNNETESLSIVFQLLTEDLSSKAMKGIEIELARLLGGTLKAPGTSLLFEGVRALLAGSDHSAVDRILPWVIKPLRRSKSLSPADLFLQICADARAGEMAALWPHMLNEVLIGFQNTPEAKVNDLYLQIGGQPLDLLHAGIKRLGQLEAMSEGVIAKSAIQRIPVALCPVFVLLLDTPRENTIGNLLIRELRLLGLEPPFGEAFLLFNDYSLKCKPFLVQLLNEYPGRTFSRDLKIKAVKAIGIDLLNCPHEKRAAPWVLKVIAGLGSSGLDEARSTLQKIVKTKDRIFFHDWPAPCRKAARDALKELKKRKGDE